MSSLLSINNLSVRIPTRFGEVLAVSDVNLEISAGQIHGLVGESGAGKSTIGSAIMDLLPSSGYISSGSIALSGRELTELSQEQRHRLRGAEISMIFQDPQTSLNPLIRIGDQLMETIQQHHSIDYEAARHRAIELLEETGISDARERFDHFPHQFSGGMRQRVVIALALCSMPKLIIADEPTTALDVSVQKQILTLIRKLAQQHQLAIILITHDIGVIAETTDRVSVLLDGRIVEDGTTSEVLGNPQAPYTQALVAAVPRIEQRLHRFQNIMDDNSIKSDGNWVLQGADARIASDWLKQHNYQKSDTHRKNQKESRAKNRSIEQAEDTHKNGVEAAHLSVHALSVMYGARNNWFRKISGFQALSSISLHVMPGEVLGVVGESGSGKSTLARAIVGLTPLQSGSMTLNRQPLPDAKQRSRRHPARRQIQMVFQDPYSSLNNRLTIETLLREPLRFYQLELNRSHQRRLIASMLELVEMPQKAMFKYPHQFSGGQRQRIAIARALMSRPELLICDEPTSALDVSIQAHILNLLKDLQEQLGLSILFISHNLAVIRQMADRVVVLRQGQLIETADNDAFFMSPKAPYSQQLLRETPSLDMLLA